jgi:hypothetical protein
MIKCPGFRARNAAVEMLENGLWFLLGVCFAIKYASHTVISINVQTYESPCIHRQSVYLYLFHDGHIDH